MNKDELVEFASRKAKLSKTDCVNVLNAMTEIISAVLKRGERVRISGFGNFEPRIRSERRGINPQTMERITISQKIVPYFKSSKKFRESIK